MARDPDAHVDHRPGAARHALSGRYLAERNNHVKGVARGDLRVHHYLTFLVKPVLTGPGERSGACGVVDDVISQGREPEPGLKPSLSRRWRVAAGTLAVVAAGLAVIGVGLRHGTGSPGTPAATASGATSADGGAATASGETGADGGAQAIPFVPAPAPQSHPALVICAPSTGVCSMRGAWDKRGGGMRAGA